MWLYLAFYWVVLILKSFIHTFHNRGVKVVDFLIGSRGCHYSADNYGHSGLFWNFFNSFWQGIISFLTIQFIIYTVHHNGEPCTPMYTNLFLLVLLQETTFWSVSKRKLTCFRGLQCWHSTLKKLVHDHDPGPCSPRSVVIFLEVITPLNHSDSICAHWL